MKVKAVTYRYTPEVSLFLVPETDVERELLRALWTHGHLALCNGVADRSGQGFEITTQATNDPD